MLIFAPDSNRFSFQLFLSLVDSTKFTKRISDFKLPSYYLETCPTTSSLKLKFLQIAGISKDSPGSLSFRSGSTLALQKIFRSEKLHLAGKLCKSLCSHLTVSGGLLICSLPCPSLRILYNPSMLWLFGPLISWITTWKQKRAIVRPIAALEAALWLLQILPGCSCLELAVLEGQNYCRCSLSSAQIGLSNQQLFSASICRDSESLQVGVLPANELSVYSFCY